MPEIVVKVLNEAGGDEASVGPISVPKTLAKDILDTLVPYAEKAAAQADEDRVAEIEQESARRSAEAEKANKEYALRGQRGEAV